MNNDFVIIKVPDDAAQLPEDMGTKGKFWYQSGEYGAEIQDSLFKFARPNTGEDWAEKIAAECCNLLQLPHVNYELASFQDNPGSTSPQMLPSNGLLLHGNEILASWVSSYGSDRHYGASQHTIELVCQVIDSPDIKPPHKHPLPEGITTAIGVFVGYILLDTWIGNSDRHHENWAFISLNNELYLAPTYDHGSSLGRELQDEIEVGKKSRRQYLESQTVKKYAEKSRSALYGHVNDKKALLNFDAFQHLALLYPHDAKIWLQNLSKASSDDIMGILKRLSPSRLSPTACAFAHQVLLINQQRLLQLRENFP